MAAVAVVEKSPYLRKRFDRSLRNLAGWHRLTILSVSTVQSKRHLDPFSHFCTAHRSVVGHARACPLL